MSILRGSLTALLFLVWISCLVGQTFRIEVQEHVVIKEMGYIILYNRLATSDAFPFGFGHTYAFNADSSYIAFIGESDDTFDLHVLGNGAGPSIYGMGDGCIDGRTSLEWSPDGTILVFARGERIWMYDAPADSAWKLSEPQEAWMEDFDPSFSPDGSRVLFFRGYRFEYVFSGDKYSINLAGNGLKREEEESPTYPPEDLRGEEW